MPGRRLISASRRAFPKEAARIVLTLVYNLLDPILSDRRERF